MASELHVPFSQPRTNSPITKLEDIEGKRVATTFDKLVHDYLVEHGINAETVHLDGAVESSVQLGVADLIADVVSTGTTLRNAGLRIFAEPLMHSEAVLIRSPRLEADDERLTILSSVCKACSLHISMCSWTMTFRSARSPPRGCDPWL